MVKIGLPIEFYGIIDDNKINILFIISLKFLKIHHNFILLN